MYKKGIFCDFYVIKFEKPPVYGAFFVSGRIVGLFAALRSPHPTP
jgi:hypothetical protein